MSVKTYKPISPARRGMTTDDYTGVDKKVPKSKKLLAPKKSKAGRNNQGRITVRHRGSGAKRMYRNVNFNLKPGTKAKVISVEYDPNRSARIARIEDEEGTLHYILASTAMKKGQIITVGEGSAIQAGNRLPIKNIPAGTNIYDIEVSLGKGGQIARSAGTRAQLVAKEGKNAHIRMPSGEIRLVNVDCQATIGAVSNEQHQNVKYGSAGRRRRKGWRPSVRGKAMNAVDHPHGGGDGGAHGVGREPKTPWGQKTLGLKTRRRKYSDRLIVRSRRKGKRS